MSRHVLFATGFCILLIAGKSLAQDRDVTARDLRGLHRSHRYAWAVAGGTAVGAGLGVIAPGGAKSAFKGALLGGSVTSAFYLAKNPRAADPHRPFAHIVTNTVLGTSLLWTLCNCNGGAWAGALIGGGGTAIVQALGTHNTGLATFTGASAQPQSVPDLAPDVQYEALAGSLPEKKKSASDTTPAKSGSQLPQLEHEEQR
jgi:hypothetical protein